MSDCRAFGRGLKDSEEEEESVEFFEMGDDEGGHAELGSVLEDLAVLLGKFLRGWSLCC